MLCPEQAPTGGRAQGAFDASRNRRSEPHNREKNTLPHSLPVLLLMLHGKEHTLYFLDEPRSQRMQSRCDTQKYIARQRVRQASASVTALSMSCSVQPYARLSFFPYAFTISRDMNWS